MPVAFSSKPIRIPLSKCLRPQYMIKARFTSRLLPVLPPTIRGKKEWVDFELHVSAELNPSHTAVFPGSNFSRSQHTSLWVFKSDVSRQIVLGFLSKEMNRSGSLRTYSCIWYGCLFSFPFSLSPFCYQTDIAVWTIGRSITEKNFFS